MTKRKSNLRMVNAPMGENDRLRRFAPRVAPAARIARVMCAVLLCAVAMLALLTGCTAQDASQDAATQDAATQDAATQDAAQATSAASAAAQSASAASTSAASTSAASSSAKITSLSDLAGKRIGTLVGSACGEISEELAGPDGEVMYLNALSDLAVALDNDKIDAIIYDEPGALQVCATYQNFTVLDEDVAPLTLAFVFQKDSARGQELCSQINAYLAKLKASGELEQMEDKWMRQVNTADQTVDYSNLPATNGTINVATFSLVGAPIAYVKDNEIVGYDFDIVTGFCREYGYALEVDDVDVTGLLAGVQTGKYDMVASGMTVTEERAQSVLFSDPTFEGGVVCVVKETDASGSSVFSGLIESFEKTFLTEDRWELFVGGILRTLLITILSLVLGTLLGFAAFLWCRNGGRVARRIVDFLIWLIQGMPTVVFLMILFYIVFGTLPVSGEAVSVIGFTLIFATSVVGLLRVGVDSVDAGQLEAAQTLGFSRNKAFFRIVLPQAVRHVLPAYRSELVSLLKGTAIVGYIAVQDLTKVGDIIRSRTYEAFFPLIAVAVIYFILAALLKAVVNLIARSTDPANRTAEDVLKGIKTQGEDA